MKKILIVMAIMTIAGSFAQNIKCTVKKTDILKNEHKDARFLKMADDGEGGFVALSRKLDFSKSKYFMEYYNSDMKNVKSVEYPFGKSDYLGSFISGGKLFIIDLVYDKKRKAYVGFAHAANLTDFIFTANELFSLTRKEVQTTGGFGFGGNIDYDTGARFKMNSAETAFSISVDIDDKNDKEARQVYVFDLSLNKKIDALVKSESKDSKFTVENIEVSQDANVAYVLGQVADKGSKKEGGKYYYALAAVTSGGIKTKNFDTGAYFAADLRAVITKDGVACVGLYSEKKDKLCKGICHYRLNPVTLETESEKFNPFTTQFNKERFGSEEGKEVKNLFLKAVHVTDDNKILLNAEEIEDVIHSSGNSMSVTRFYLNIMCAKLNSSGDLEWSRNISKKQMTSNFMEYMSYTPAFYKGNSYFFLNCNGDLPAHGNRLTGLYYSTGQDANLLVVRMDENANFEFQKLIDREGDNLKFWANHGIGGGKDTYIYSKRTNKIQFLRASF